MRIVLGVAYQGTGFHGWQAQNGLSTIQLAVEQALSKIADESIHVYCAGRTDAGVHAMQQVIHFDTEVERPEAAWLLGTNTHLPPSIRILWGALVNEDFHARYSALARTYDYYIYNQSVMLPFYVNNMTEHYPELNADAMLGAAQLLLGEHDFSAFRASSCQSKSPTRKVLSTQVSRHGDIIHFQITANAFLHHMVRNIVGSLMEVGNGKRSIDWFREVLHSKDRTLAAPTAAPQGLYLSHVSYPDEFSFSDQELPYIPGFSLLKGMTEEGAE